MTLVIRQAGPETDWAAVRALLKSSFSFMEKRINPPSSLNQMTPAELRRKAEIEVCLLAFERQTLVGCAFCSTGEQKLYIGKLAVLPAFQGRGIGRKLVMRVEALARSRGLNALQLQTRVELTETHAAFTSFGFVRIGETAHPGFDLPTSITMRKVL